MTKGFFILLVVVSSLNSLVQILYIIKHPIEKNKIIVLSKSFDSNVTNQKLNNNVENIEKSIENIFFNQSPKNEK